MDTEIYTKYIADFTKPYKKPEEPSSAEDTTPEEWREMLSEYLDKSGICDRWEKRIRLNRKTYEIFKFIEAKQKVKWSNAFYYFFTLVPHLKHADRIRKSKPRSETKQITVSICRDLYHNALFETRLAEKDIPKIIDYVADTIDNYIGVQSFLNMAAHNEVKIDIGEFEFYEG